MTNDYDIEVDPDVTYELTLREKVTPDYRMSSTISNWLKTNLESLTDDDDNPVFSKVNMGFNEDNLKSFSSKPVCDIHIDSVEYGTTFDDDMPDKVNSILIFYFKGTNNKSYEKACKIHDYIMQEFLTNPEFKMLDDFVRDTQITESRVTRQNINKKLGVMGAFALTHIL